MTWPFALMAASAVVFAWLAQRYKMQRDDLAAWVLHKHPEDLE